MKASLGASHRTQKEHTYTPTHIHKLSMFGRGRRAPREGVDEEQERVGISAGGRFPGGS